MSALVPRLMVGREVQADATLGLSSCPSGATCSAQAQVEVTPPATVNTVSLAQAAYTSVATSSFQVWPAVQECSWANALCSTGPSGH